MNIALGGRDRMLRNHAMELLRFAFVGVLNTAATLLVIYALMAAGANLYLANFIGYAVGLMISFTLNRRWTFRFGGRADLRLARRFLLAVAASYCSNLLAVFLSLQGGLSPRFAQLAGMPVYTACFFLLTKFYVFPTQHDHRSAIERRVQE